MLLDQLNRNSDPLADEADLRRHIQQALATPAPEGIEQTLMYRFAKLWFRPRLFNTDRLPDEPCMFVGNHALFGLDGLVVLPVLLEELGRYLRPMGDKFLFANSATARFLLRRGGTMGHPDVARALMEHDQDILVFPGGAHEAVKPSRERYRLQWKDRLGFLRLAAEYGYTIVPFGLVGPDEFYEYLVDGEDIVDFFDGFGLWPEQLRRDVVPPILRGAFGTALPRPQACYLSFGEPLDIPRNRTSTSTGRRKNGQRKGAVVASDKQLKAWRTTVEERIDKEIADMLFERERTRHQHGFLRRMANF